MKIGKSNPLIYLFMVVATVSLACSVDLYGTPSPTPLPNPSIQPEQPVAAMATEQPAATPQQYFTEEFDVESDAWKYMVVNGAEKQIVNGIVGLMSVRTLGGLLIFDLQGPGAWVYATYEPFTYTDVRLDVKAGNRGVNNNNVSLLCRKSDSGWYEFNLSNNGLYEVVYGKIDGDRVEYTPIAEGGSTRIKSGLAENEYGIVCQGTTLILYINGEEVRRLEEKKFKLTEGRVGISVSSFRDVPVTVDIYWARISHP